MKKKIKSVLDAQTRNLIVDKEYKWYCPRCSFNKEKKKERFYGSEHVSNTVTKWNPVRYMLSFQSMALNNSTGPAIYLTDSW